MARAAVRGLSLLALLTSVGCHEVLALEPPPLVRSETVLVAARDAEGGFQLFAGEAGLPRAPNLIFGPDTELWAFGFGCSLERLDLAGRNLQQDKPESIPPLPPPLEVLRGDELGWSATTLSDAPMELAAYFPEGEEAPCEVFTPSISGTPRRKTPAPMMADGDLFITAVSNGRGGALVFQPVLRIQTPPDPRSVRLLGGRFLEVTSLDENARPLPDIAGLPASIATASRGDGELVVAGATVAVQGSFTRGFRPAPRFPDLTGAAFVSMAASPVDEPFEAFVLSRGLHPLETTKTSTLRLHRVTEQGVELLFSSLTRPITGPDRDARPDIVVRTGPGEAYALGFSAASQILRVSGGRAELETVDPQRSGVPIGLAHHPQAGVALIDIDGRAYLKQPGERWRSVNQRSGDRGPFALTLVDGVPALLVYSPDVTDLGIDGGSRFELARSSGGACNTNGVDVRPQIQQATGHLAAVPDPDGRALWLLTMNSQSLDYHRVAFQGTAGACQP